MDEIKPIVLSSEDQRIGRETAEGRRWPDVDLHGQPYNRTHATVRHLTPALFVVIPHRWEGEVRLGQPTTSSFEVTAPAVEVAEDQATFRKPRGGNADR